MAQSRMAGYCVIESRFLDLYSRVNVLYSTTDNYQTQLRTISGKLDSLKPVVEGIKEMKQNRNIKLFLSIREAVDLQQVVSNGRNLCERVSKERIYTKKPFYCRALEDLGTSLDRQIGIFEKRRVSIVRIGARQMLNNRHDEIRKLMGVKVSCGVVLRLINQKLCRLERTVWKVQVIEEANRDLNLSIVVVQDFRKVLSDGEALLSEFSKDRNGSRSRYFDEKLRLWNLSLMNQVTKLERNRVHFG